VSRSAASSKWIGNGIGSTLSPLDILSHYNIPPTLTGVNQVIAIVAAPGSGNIANDLNTFSAYYHLPLCNSANPCFQKIDLSNGKAVSGSNDWADEIALDVEWAHAVAPAAKIDLIIAASSSATDLFAAVKTAAAQPGVVAVSMSWGATEYSTETSSTFDGLFAKNPSIVFLAAAGDSGNNGNNQIYPAASPYVTAVGGTSIKSLSLTSSSSEVAWSLGGGGASIYESMPLYQISYLGSSAALSLNHGRRAIPDVAYNADSSTSPVGVYANGNWYAVGGTSAGAPQWAGIVALLGQHLQQRGAALGTLVLGSSGFNNLIYQAKIMQSASSSFFDVTSGTNKTGHRACALCVAGPGYDDVTGLGVPNVGNFLGYF
jgi:subtilase family serine protease